MSLRFSCRGAVMLAFTGLVASWVSAVFTFAGQLGGRSHAKGLNPLYELLGVNAPEGVPVGMFLPNQNQCQAVVGYSADKNSCATGKKRHQLS